MVVGLRNTLGIKRVGSDDISTSHQVFAVDVGDDIRARLNSLNIKADGSPGNVLAIGQIKANYTPGGDYYNGSR